MESEYTEEYVKELEQKVKDLEKELAPYREADLALWERIRKIDEKQAKREGKDGKETNTCALSDICRAIKTNCTKISCPSYMTEQERLDERNALIKRDEFINERPVDVDRQDCIRCGDQKFHPDHASNTDQCNWCGQKYRR